MDFTLTEEQQLLVDTAAALLGAECPPALLRRAMGDEHAADQLWADHLAEWVELADGDLVDLVLFVEQCGRHLVPGVFVPTLVARQFAPVAAPATLAMAGPDGVWVPNESRTRVFVAEASLAEELVVVAPAGVAVVERGELVGLEQMETMDLVRRFWRVEVPDDLRFEPPEPGRELERAVARATVIVAAELIGVARWLLDSAVAYAKERVQFDRPIGSFQGLQWKLVDAALEVERADAAVAAAAMSVDAGTEDVAIAVHTARAEAGSAALRAGRDSMATHGGIGYTWEHDLHLYLRRARAAEGWFGPVGWHLDRLADQLFA